MLDVCRVSQIAPDRETAARWAHPVKTKAHNVRAMVVRDSVGRDAPTGWRWANSREKMYTAPRPLASVVFCRDCDTILALELATKE